MKAIVDATGKVIRITPDTDGVDLEGCTVMDLPDGYDPVTISHLVVAGKWVANDANAWERLRGERDARLAACDWTQLADVPEATRAAWQPYRQALRDITETSDPYAPQWPEPPSQQENEA